MIQGTVAEYLRQSVKGARIQLNYFGAPNNRKAVPKLDPKYQSLLADLIIENELINVDRT